MKRLQCVRGLLVMLLLAVLLSACGASTPAPAPAAGPSLAPVAATPAASAALATATPAPSAASTPVADIRQFIDQVSAGPHDTVNSADGSAELLIPKGALPAGKTVGDISIKPIAAAQVGVTIGGKPPLLAYQMEPDGLKFTAPVLLSITQTAPSAGNVPALFTLSGDQASPLSPIEADPDSQGGKLTLMAAVSHFSFVWDQDGPATLAMSAPGDQVVIVPFSVAVVAALEKGIRLESGTWKYLGDFEASGPLIPTRVKGPNWEDMTSLVYKTDQLFACTAAGQATIKYIAGFSVAEKVTVQIRNRSEDLTFDEQYGSRVTTSLQCKEPTPTPVKTPVDTTPLIMQQLRVTLDLGSGRDENSTFGQAFLFPQGDTTKVELHLKAGTGAALPAFIQQGACPNPGAPKYPLTTVLTGTATTVVDASLGALLAGGLAINVQKSAGQPNVYVACANIPKGALVTLGAGRDGDQTPGTVVLLSAGAQTTLNLAMKPVGYDILQPANVYEGSCANLASVKYALGNVNGGLGYARINAPLAELLKGGYAISIQKSTAESGASVACAELK